MKKRKHASEVSSELKEEIRNTGFKVKIIILAQKRQEYFFSPYFTK